MHHLNGTQILLLWVLLMSGLSFSLFGQDKRRARRGQWRISEKALFLTALLGGSPGALLGMKVFHHKTLHKRFRYGLPLILLLQVVLIALWYLWPLLHHHGR